MMASGVLRTMVFAWMIGLALSADSPKKAPREDFTTKTVYVTLDGENPQASQSIVSRYALLGNTSNLRRQIPKKPSIVPVIPGQNTKSLSRRTTRKPPSGKTAATASTTITETPTGAEFITLDPTQTKPGYITTTKEGSSDQTVVPGSYLIPLNVPFDSKSTHAC